MLQKSGRSFEIFCFQLKFLNEICCKQNSTISSIQKDVVISQGICVKGGSIVTVCSSERRRGPMDLSTMRGSTVYYQYGSTHSPHSRSSQRKEQVLGTVVPLQQEMESGVDNGASLDSARQQRRRRGCSVDSGAVWHYKSQSVSQFSFLSLFLFRILATSAHHRLAQHTKPPQQTHASRTYNQVTSKVRFKNRAKAFSCTQLKNFPANQSEHTRRHSATQWLLARNPAHYTALLPICRLLVFVRWSPMSWTMFTSSMW